MHLCVCLCVCADTDVCTCWKTSNRNNITFLFCRDYPCRLSAAMMPTTTETPKQVVRKTLEVKTPKGVYASVCVCVCVWKQMLMGNQQGHDSLLFRFTVA